MDFTLSLAHFCELHGPTSVLCTQVLPSPCNLCRPSPPSSESSSTESSPERPRPNTSYFPPLSKSWRAAAFQKGTAGFAAKDTDRCASCRMTIPDATFYDPSPSVDRNRPPIRTKESIHVCGETEEDYSSSDDEIHNPFPSPSPEFFPITSQGTSCPLSSSNGQYSTSCHSHSLEYITAPSPASTTHYATLRTAVIRTLSGEVLPRGQISGPLWFGSSEAGYVIAYQFEIKDRRARGRRRQYALLALAGNEINRALATATLLWACFEKIAANIIATAQAVSRAKRRANNTTGNLGDHIEGLHLDDEDDSEQEREREEELQMQEMMRRPGVNSLLTGRGALGRMTGAGALLGDRRGGAANAADIKATSIAELVDNEKFYCELHMVFVGILQQLGREFGGLQVRPLEAGELVSKVEAGGIKKSLDGQLKGHPYITKAGPQVDQDEDDTWRQDAKGFPPTPKSMNSPVIKSPGLMQATQQQVAF